MKQRERQRRAIDPRGKTASDGLLQEYYREIEKLKATSEAEEYLK